MNLACINTTKLKAFPTLIPPLRQQQEIVGALRAVDRKITREQARLNALDATFKTLLHALMTGTVRVGPETQ